VVILRLQQEGRRRLAGEWRVLKSHLARTPRQTEIGANLGPSNFSIRLSNPLCSCAAFSDALEL
jgi:hypothetical protein